jgi:hypothetical protein
MNICLNFGFLLKIKSGDLLTYLAVFLAYIVYVWSVNRDFLSWKSLFTSLKSDLKNQKEWLENEYFPETYNTDKSSFSPKKIILPLSFESLQEIIRRGPTQFNWIQEEFIDQLSSFNERVEAFNKLLDQISLVVSADPITTEKLIDQLKDFGFEDENIGFDEFKKKIYDEKQKNEILYLAENIRRLNRAIHVKLIGNKNDEDKLHYLYSKITEELKNILEIFDKRKPWFVRYQWLIVVISIPLFILLENLPLK